MVTGVALAAQSASRETFNDFFVGDHKVNHGINRTKSFQGVGLCNCSGKSVKNESFIAGFFFQSFFDKSNSQFVRNKISGFDNRFDFQSQFRFVLNRGTERSPVETAVIPVRSVRRVAMVPFPAPGAPKKISFMIWLLIIFR